MQDCRHILTDFSLYLDYWQLGDYLAALKIWNGGLSILGAIFGGIIGVYLFSQRHGEDFYFLVDNLVMFLPLGQALGRLANFYNHELYGLPLVEKHWWSLYIPLESRLVGFKDFAYYQPLFVYEAILMLMLALVLYYLAKKNDDFKPGRGKLFYFYLFVYLTVRFCLDFLRLDKIMLTSVLGLNQILIIIFLIILFIISRKHAQET